MHETSLEEDIFGSFYMYFYNVCSGKTPFITYFMPLYKKNI